MLTIRSNECIIKLKSRLKKSQLSDLEHYIIDIFGTDATIKKISKKWVLVEASNAHTLFRKPPCPDCDGGWMPPPPPPPGGPIREPDLSFLKGAIGFVNVDVKFNEKLVSSFELISA
jgi:hypothetical protein